MILPQSDKYKRKIGLNDDSDDDDQSDDEPRTPGTDNSFLPQCKGAFMCPQNNGSDFSELQSNRGEEGGCIQVPSHSNSQQNNSGFTRDNTKGHSPGSVQVCSKSVLKDLNVNGTSNTNKNKRSGLSTCNGDNSQSKPKRTKRENSRVPFSSFQREQVSCISNQANASGEEFSVEKETLLEYSSIFEQQRNFNYVPELSLTLEYDYYNYMRKILVEKFGATPDNPKSQPTSSVTNDVRNEDKSKQEETMKQEKVNKMPLYFDFEFDLSENDTLFIVEDDKQELILQYLQTLQTGRCFLLVPNQKSAESISQLCEQAGKRCIIFIAGQDSSACFNGTSVKDNRMYSISTQGNHASPRPEVIHLSQFHPDIRTENNITKSATSSNISVIDLDATYQERICSRDSSMNQYLNNFDLSKSSQGNAGAAGMHDKYSQRNGQNSPSEGKSKERTELPDLTKPPSTPCGKNIYNPYITIRRNGLRPIIIDGCNVAIVIYNRKQIFSVRRLFYCIDYFLRRGHEVKAFVPHTRKNPRDCTDSVFLETLHTSGLVVFTPSRFVDGKIIVCHDDWYILQYASLVEGVVVTRDNYRDMFGKNPVCDETIRTRLLMHTWVKYYLIFPTYPLGSNGPTLDKFLSFQDDM